MKYCLKGVTVTTQVELDAAINNPDVGCVHIDSPREQGLHLDTNKQIELLGSTFVLLRGGSSVIAWNDSLVVAQNNSSVVARDNSFVMARDNSFVKARDSSSVEARDSSSVTARDNSSVVASENSFINAWDFSHIKASGKTFVNAQDNSSITARDNSCVTALGDSLVVATGNSSIEVGINSRVVASGLARVFVHSGTVTAGPHVVVYLYGEQRRVTGGVLIDLTALDLTDPATWCEHYRVRLDNAGRAVLYKATGSDLTTGLLYNTPTTYAIGTEVTCPDWRPDNRCGGGLHLSPHPRLADGYTDIPRAQRRYLRVTADLGDLDPIDSTKCKVKRCWVEAEVDIQGRELDTTATADGDPS